MIDGEWYKVVTPAMCMGRQVDKVVVLQYTEDDDDAYFNSDKFGPGSNVQVICRMEPVNE